MCYCCCINPPVNWTHVCYAVFRSAAEVVRTYGAYVSGAVQDGVKPACGQHHPRDAGLRQAGTRPGGGQTLSESRVQAAVHRRRTPGCRRGAATTPACLRAQAGEVRRRSVHWATERHHTARTTAGYDKTDGRSYRKYFIM